MKAPLFTSALLIAGVSFLFSCQKDVSEFSSENSLTSKASIDQAKPQERPFKGTIYSHTTLVLDDAHGGNLNLGVPGWYPGYGEGNVTHMGKFYTYYNQYATGNLIPPFGVYATRYPVITDAFQAPDLEDSLRMHGFGDYIEAIHANDVSYVIFDTHGNSIWSRATVPVGDMSSNPDMKFIVDMNYTLAIRTHVYTVAEIVGGTGRFANAKGLYTISGTSDRTAIDATSTDSLRIDGYIKY